MSQSYQQTWGPVTATGPLAPFISYRQFGFVPAACTVDWFNDGTPASACTFQVEGSSDGLPGHWSALTGVLAFGSINMTHIANKPVMFVQINILTYAPGDNTTAITIHYTSGQ